MYKDPNEKSLAEILKKDDKCANEATNSLSELGRKMLAYNRISISKIGKLVDAWTITRFQPNDKLRSSAKSNALKAIADNQMTWNTFLRLCQILNFKRLNLTLQAITHDDQVQFYQTSIINTDVRPGEEGYTPVAAIPEDPLARYMSKCQKAELVADQLAKKLSELGYDDEVKKILEESAGV